MYRIGLRCTVSQLDRNPKRCLSRWVLVQVCILKRLVNNGFVGDNRADFVGCALVPLNRVEERPRSSCGHWVVVDVTVNQGNVEVAVRALYNIVGVVVFTGYPRVAKGSRCFTYWVTDKYLHTSRGSQDCFSRSLKEDVRLPTSRCQYHRMSVWNGKVHIRKGWLRRTCA